MCNMSHHRPTSGFPVPLLEQNSLTPTSAAAQEKFSVIFRAIAEDFFRGNKSKRTVRNMANLKIQTIDLGDKMPSIIAEQELAIQDATRRIRDELNKLPGETMLDWNNRLEQHPIVIARREAERREYAERWRREGAALPGALDVRELDDEES
jgi:hypothetical protein